MKKCKNKFGYIKYKRKDFERAVKFVTDRSEFYKEYYTLYSHYPVVIPEGKGVNDE